VEYYVNNSQLAKAFFDAKNKGILEEDSEVIFVNLQKFKDIVFKIVNNGKVFLEIRPVNGVLNWVSVNHEYIRELVLLAAQGAGFKIDSQDDYDLRFKGFIQSISEGIYYLIMHRPEIYENFAEVTVNRWGKSKKVMRKVVFLRIVDSKIKTKRLVPQEPSIKHDHQYDVCGFWRKCGAIGKDSNGEYTQVGRTWVSEHRRGNGEYVYKPRVFTQ